MRLSLNASLPLLALFAVGCRGALGITALDSSVVDVGAGDAGGDASDVSDAGDAGDLRRWAVWPMPGASLDAGNYAAIADGAAVEDLTTHLVWETAGVVTADLAQENDRGRERCQGLELAGLTGWRLPTPIETVTLYNVTSKDEIAWYSATFGTQHDTNGFWTRSLSADNTLSYWQVNFLRTSAGFTAVTDVKARLSIRCVHDGKVPLPSQSHYEVHDDYVIDQYTKLAWQRQRVENLTVELAATRCRQLSAGPYTSGWKLPSAKEVLTLVDDSKFDLALDTSAFPDLTEYKSWTSTPWGPVDGGVGNLAVDFKTGFAGMLAPGERSAFRCVYDLN